MRLFSAPMCSCFHRRQCKSRRLRANAQLSALLYSRSCVRVAVTEWSWLALADQFVHHVGAAISKYRDSCKVYRDTYRVKSNAIHRCIDESCRDWLLITSYWRSWQVKLMRATQKWRTMFLAKSTWAEVSAVSCRHCLMIQRSSSIGLKAHEPK